MWRRFRIVATLLVLGMILNVAVAWAAAGVGGRDAGDIELWNGSPSRYHESRRNHGVGRDIRTGGVVENAFNASPTSRYEKVVSREVDAGWPLFALTALQPMGDSMSEEAWVAQRGLLWKRSGGSVLLPLVPIWPGFFVNTLFYTTIIWLLLATFTMRSRVRAWRGRCLCCGYPRSESGTCSECGAAVEPLVTAAPMVEWHALREKRLEA